MSTKFRQSFTSLCQGCNASSKDQRASAVLFCKEYAMRPIRNSINRDGIGGGMSTTSRLPYPPSLIHEKKLLLTDNTPSPMTAAVIDETKFTFP